MKILDMDEKRICSDLTSASQHNLAKEWNGDILPHIPCNETTSHTVQDSKVNSDYLKTDDLTVDALHPFFKGYANIKKDASTNTESRQFHCQECNSSIDLLQEQVIHHFSSKRHKPVDACVYCKGDVFEYFYYEKRIIYHKCVTSTE